jgi:signal transduction histidine kinase/CheY-like chemotaxis protein
MMNNNTFFYLVLMLIDTIIGLSYFVFKKAHDTRTKTLNSLKNAYENVVNGMADDVGKNLFQRLVLHLADAVQTRYVFIGMFDSKNDSKIVPLTFWDGDFSDSMESFPIKDSVFERVILEKRYFCSIDVQKVFPDDKFLKLLKAESFFGITLYSADKVPIGVICTVHDAEMVTDYIIRSVLNIFASRTAAEVERIKNEAENIQIQQQLSQAQKLEALGQLAGGIAHDFNNILHGIMGYSQLLQMKLEKESSLTSYPNKIVALSKKGSALTSQLLTFARKGKYHSVFVDMNKSIEEVTNMLEHTLDKSISIKQKLLSARKTVTGDPSQLENMLINLAVNARDAMPDGGELIIGTDSVLIDEVFMREHAFANKCKPGDYLIITVSDTGKGMEKEIIQHIFEPFFTTKKIGKGTGLGLAAVYGCVENHNGFIEVESRENEGTTFSIYLPLAKKEAPDTQDTQGSIRDIKGRGASILLVDDEEDILESLSESLSLYGYNVKTCLDGSKAVDYFSDNHSTIDLVILDMNMPKMSGKQVFSEMIKIDPAVNVLIATGYTFEADVQKLLSEKGVIDLVHKPFRPDKLVRAIEKAFSDKALAD